MSKKAILISASFTNDLGKYRFLSYVKASQVEFFNIQGLSNANNALYLLTFKNAF